MKQKIRILKGTAADFFDRCREAAKAEAKSQSFADEDVIAIEVDDDILRRAVEVFKDKGNALQWFIAPNYALGGYRPGELLRTSEGRQNVIDELGRIEHGVLV